MTVRELIEKLRQMPQDSKIILDGGQYKDDWRTAGSVKFRKDLGWGLEGVVIT